MSPQQVSQLTIGQRVIVVIFIENWEDSGTVEWGTLMRVRDFGVLVHIDGTPEFFHKLVDPTEIHIDGTHADREISLMIQEIHYSRGIENTSDDKLESELERMRATIYTSSRERLAAEAARTMSATQNAIVPTL